MDTKGDRRKKKNRNKRLYWNGRLARMESHVNFMDDPDNSRHIRAEDRDA